MLRNNPGSKKCIVLGIFIFSAVACVYIFGTYVPREAIITAFPELPSLEGNQSQQVSSTHQQQTTTFPSTGLANGTPIVSQYEEELAFDLNWPEKCGSSLHLLMVVITAPNHFQARMSIRKTWGGYALRNNGQVIFLVAKTSNNVTELELFEENRKFQDIVQANFVDSYKNLTLKTVAATKWVTEHCRNAKFVLKIDDDVFLNTERLIRYIENHLDMNNSIVGHIAKHLQPVRDKTGYSSKWYVPETIYPYNYYPDYAFGSAYLISGDIVRSLYKTSLQLPLFDNEDIFMTGMVGEVIGVQRIFNDRFKIGTRVNIVKCELQSVICSESYTPAALIDAWTEITRNDLTCLEN